MRFIIGFALLFFCRQNISAQERQILKAVLKAEGSGKEVAFASVYIKNTQQVTISDETGSFLLPCIVSVHDTLCISALGFKPEEIAVNEFKNDAVINLITKNELPVLTVNGLTAREVIAKAITHLSLYFPDSTLQSEFFYRQYHKENDKYVRLIEARIVTKEYSYKDRPAEKNNEEVYIKAMRRSKVYEQNKEKHGDHLMDLLFENPVKYPLGTILNSKGLPYYNFHFSEESNEELTVIEFNSFNTGALKAEKGKIYVNEKENLIEKIMIESFPNPNARPVHFSKANQPYSWKFRNGFFEISFEKINGYMQVLKMNKSYTHYLIDNKVNSVSYLLEENFELSDVKTNPDNISDKLFSAYSNLYSRSYHYNPSEWLDSPSLSLKIKSDMEGNETLENQYRQNISAQEAQ